MRSLGFPKLQIFIEIFWENLQSIHVGGASHLAAANPKLKDIKGIVMDGEEPLQNNFSHVFFNSQRLQDFRHFRQDIDNALQDLRISAKTELLFSMTSLATWKTRCTSRDYIILTIRFCVMLDSVRSLWKDRETLPIGGTSEKV